MSLICDFSSCVLSFCMKPPCMLLLSVKSFLCHVIFQDLIFTFNIRVTSFSLMSFSCDIFLLWYLWCVISSVSDIFLCDILLERYLLCVISCITLLWGHIFPRDIFLFDISVSHILLFGLISIWHLRCDFFLCDIPMFDVFLVWRLSCVISFLFNFWCVWWFSWVKLLSCDIFRVSFKFVKFINTGGTRSQGKQIKIRGQSRFCTSSLYDILLVWCLSMISSCVVFFCMVTVCVMTFLRDLSVWWLFVWWLSCVTSLMCEIHVVRHISCAIFFLCLFASYPSCVTSFCAISFLCDFFPCMFFYENRPVLFA